MEPPRDRKIGRPRETWRRSLNKELGGRVDKTLYESQIIGTKRTEWNTLVAALCSKYELKEIMEKYNGISNGTIHKQGN